MIRAGLIHGLVSMLFSASIYYYLGPKDALFAIWGCALGILPSLGFSYLSGRAVSEEGSKKGVALVIAGSVLRYGIFLLLLALLVYSKIRIPHVFVAGLLIWIPSSAVIAAVVRRTENK